MTRAAWIALMACVLSTAAQADRTVLIDRVLSRLGVGAADVRACLAEQMTAEPQRRAEIERLGDVFDWIEDAVTAPRRSPVASERAVAQTKSDAFAEIVAGFTHERRFDTAKLATISDGRLTPHHVLNYARVQRALGSGHDPKRVLCGL